MQKMKKQQATSGQADVLALQELHGTSGEIEGALLNRHLTLRCFSPGVDRNSGGTALFIKKQLLKDKDAAHHFLSSPGRAHAVKFWSADAELSNTIIRCHKLGLSEQDL